MDAMQSTTPGHSVDPVRRSVFDGEVGLRRQLTLNVVEAEGERIEQHVDVATGDGCPPTTTESYCGGRGCTPCTAMSFWLICGFIASAIHLALISVVAWHVWVNEDIELSESWVAWVDLAFTAIAAIGACVSAGSKSPQYHDKGILVFISGSSITFILGITLVTEFELDEKWTGQIFWLWLALSASLVQSLCAIFLNVLAYSEATAAAESRDIAAQEEDRDCLYPPQLPIGDRRVNENLSGSTLLVQAAMRNHLPVVAVLLENAADPNIATASNGATPLLVAAQCGHVDVVRMLLNESAADPNIATTDEGYTPLLVAAQNGHNNVVRILLKESNADPNMASANGTTPLLMAVNCGHSEVVRTLLNESTAALPRVKAWQSQAVGPTSVLSVQAEQPSLFVAVAEDDTNEDDAVAVVAGVYPFHSASANIYEDGDDAALLV